MKPIAIIGGTGVNGFSDLELITKHVVSTPYGPPSGEVLEGLLGRARIFFLQRHGGSSAIPPHKINYRANIWALHSLGVGDIIAINAVGGISESMVTGRLLIPDQVIDYTWGREHTFDEGHVGTLMHIDFTEPYDRQLRLELLAAADAAGIPHEVSGVYGVTQGPRLETAAEVQRMAGDGCDVVGMTGMPEAALARELGLAYASICMVVNPAASLGNLPLTVTKMHAILQREADVVTQLLLELLGGRRATRSGSRDG